MADPGVGAFGVATGIGTVLLRWVALAALRPGILLIAGLWCLSRTLMAVVARTQPYLARRGGIGGGLLVGVGAGVGGPTSGSPSRGAWGSPPSCWPGGG